MRGVDTPADAADLQLSCMDLNYVYSLWQEAPRVEMLAGGSGGWGTILRKQNAGQLRC